MRTLAWIGLVMFGVSWFVPVIEGQELLGGSEGPPGWQACRVAWEILVGGEGDGPKVDAEGFKRFVLGATCLTNGLMVISLLALLVARGRLPRLGTLMLATPAINLSWVYLGDGGDQALAAGYWMWVVSFVLVELGLFGARGGNA